MNLPSELTADDLPNDRIIAIDGTSGSGKSTVARGLGAELALHVLETGALYRAVTLVCIENNIDVHDEAGICKAISDMHFRFEKEPYLDSRNISSEIRSHEVAVNVSHVSVHAKVRALLTQMMRHWIVQHGGGIIEGRDITTVVAPHAKIRLFIDAPEEVRAQRRSADPSDNTENRTAEQIQEVLALRDKIDSSRAASPLKKVDGVTQIDTSLYSPEQIIFAIAASFNTGDPISL